MGLLLPVLVVVTALVAVRLSTRGNYRTVSPRHALTLIETGDIYVIDVREPSELADGLLPGAHSVPLGRLHLRLSEIPQRPILVYCASGMRSRQAASQLTRAGHREVTNMSGGYLAWKRLGLPTSPQ